MPSERDQSGRRPVSVKSDYRCAGQSSQGQSHPSHRKHRVFAAGTPGIVGHLGRNEDGRRQGDAEARRLGARLTAQLEKRNLPPVGDAELVLAGEDVTAFDDVGGGGPGRDAKLKFQLARYRRAEFGRSTKKLVPDIAQLELAIESVETDQTARLAVTLPAVAALIEAAVEAQKPARLPLPEHLPREEVVHPALCTCPSCGGSLKKIGADVLRIPAVAATLRLAG
jgi:hypothetical protein